MAFEVVIAESAQRDLRRVPNPFRSTIRGKIDGLAEIPRPRLAIPMKGEARGQWRLRVGDYRVLYVIDDADRTVLVTRVLHRSEAYRE